MHRKVLLLLAVLALMLNTACSTSRPALSKFSDNFDFSQANRYRIYDRNSDFSNIQNISDTQRNRIELAIEHALDKRGFVYQDDNDSDVIVTYHLVKQNRKQLLHYNKQVAYCSFCLRGGEITTDSKQWQIMPGSLIIDLVSAKRKQSVWRSVYDLKINFDKDNSKVIQQKISLAVNAMLDKYPHSLKASKGK